MRKSVVILVRAVDVYFLLEEPFDSVQVTSEAGLVQGSLLVSSRKVYVGTLLEEAIQSPPELCQVVELISTRVGDLHEVVQRRETLLVDHVGVDLLRLK